MKTINTALLSFGMSGKVFHAPFIAIHAGFSLAGAWERSKREIESMYPSTRSYSSLESVLQDNAIDLVIVNTPTYTHYEYAKQALVAGKHVVVEKAFTTTVAEAMELRALAREKNKKLAVYQNRRWDSDFRTVRNVVESGKLGRLVEVSFSYTRFNPSLSPKQHKEIPSAGAGILKDLGAHLIDQALCLFGMPASLFATLAITREQSVVDDFFELLLFYPTCLVRLRAGYFMKEPEPAFILHGTNGSFVKSRADKQERELLAGKRPDELNWGQEPKSEFGILHIQNDNGDTREQIPSFAGNYMAFYDGVHKAITQNTDVPVSADEGIRVMQIIEAAIKSHEEKQVINLS